MDDVKYVLPHRDLYYLINKIVQGETTVQKGILSGIIHGLDPAHYRNVFRAIVKAIYASGNEEAAGRLSRALVQGVDYINLGLKTEKPYGMTD